MNDSERLTVEDHHIFFGTANRKQSEKYGMKVWLCPDHHRLGTMAVHRNHVIDRRLKEEAQRVFEQEYSREEFMKVFGRSYIND